MKLKNLVNKISNYTLDANHYSKIELYSKKLKDLNILSEYINNNFKIKRTTLYNYIPVNDSYRIRLIIENNKNSADYANIIRNFIYSNKMKTAKINDSNFKDHENIIRINPMNEINPLLSMININLNKNLFRKDSYENSKNSMDYNDLCGNYINFVLYSNFFLYISKIFL